MKIIYNSIFLRHDTDNHPENRKRLEAFGKLQETELSDAEQYLELFHQKDYIDRIKNPVADKIYLDSDTILSPISYQSAVRAVSATILASQRSDFALVRPPGHHSHPNRAAGFCIFNNISIAVQKLIFEGKRVFIFDFDGHLGDGTEQFFYDSDRVLFWSLHQYPAYPGGGGVDDIGAGVGTGYTINVPLPPKSADDIYLKAVKTLLPIAEQFKPDVVGVSAGFDGHHADPLLDLNLSLDVYYHLGVLLHERFQNIFATLEGGYNTDTLPKCVYNFIDGINGQPIRFSEQPQETVFLAMEEFENTFQKLITNLSPYWKL